MLATAPNILLATPGRELGLWDVVAMTFDILAGDEADALLRYSMN